MGSREPRSDGNAIQLSTLVRALLPKVAISGHSMKHVMCSRGWDGSWVRRQSVLRDEVPPYYNGQHIIAVYKTCHMPRRET